MSGRHGDSEGISTHYREQKKTGEKGDRMKNIYIYIYIYNITEFSTILQCQSVYRLDVREKLNRKLFHD
jgi:hypothetical protein